MKIADAKTMRAIDQCAIEQFCIPGIVLMENAALLIFEELVKYNKKRFLVICGKGNNGGDGFAVARHLHNHGFDVTIACGEVSSNDAVLNYKIAKKCGIAFTGFDIDFQNFEIIIDALLGTGILGKVNEPAKRVIEKINSSTKHIISIDIPSGMDADKGDIFKQCVKADKTITLGLYKPGLLCSPDEAGEVIVKDISIPNGVITQFNIQNETIERDFVSNLLPERRMNSHKGSFGKGFIIATSKGMTGAGVLCAKAASVSGIGLVCEGVPKSLHDIMETKLTEEMTLPLSDRGTGHLSKDSWKDIQQKVSWADSVLFGCGIGRSRDIRYLLKRLLSTCKVPCIIDADGLYALAKLEDSLLSANCPVIITPHSGEMANLCGKTIEEIENDRFSVVKEFSKKYHCITILKGSKTLVSDGEKTYVNTTGNNGMATGGSGDVLSGILLAFTATGMNPLDAAVAAVYIHGRAGDIVAEQYGVHGVTAKKIQQNISYALKEVYNTYQTTSQG